MICTLLSRVSEDFHRIPPLTMFLAYFHAPGKSQQWLPYYENTLTQTKIFFTSGLIYFLL